MCLAIITRAPDAATSTATRPHVRDDGQRASSLDRIAAVVGLILITVAHGPEGLNRKRGPKPAPRKLKPSGYALRPHIPVFGGRLPVHREGIELVGEEDFGKSLITRAKANTRARRQVDP